MSEPRFTKGPWCWHGGPRGLHLATVDRGKTYVMSFRRMGMSQAQPAFQMSRRFPGTYGMAPALQLAKFAVGNPAVIGYTDAKADESVYRYDIIGIDHPDAQLIEKSPDLYDALAHAVRIAEGKESGTWDDLLPYAKLLAEARGEKA